MGGSKASCKVCHCAGLPFGDSPPGVTAGNFSVLIEGDDGELCSTGESESL